MKMLSSIQHDALKEFLNISIGQAAHLFSQLVNHKIDLFIPKIILFPLGKEEKERPQLFSTFKKGQILTSSIQFAEKFEGKAMLIFPFDKTRLLIDLFLGTDEIDMGNSNLTLTEMDYDALKEIGNILLNAIMGGLGELLKIKLNYQPPQVEKMLISHFWDTFNQVDAPYVLILYSSFYVQDQNIEGTIVIQISLHSISLLLERIETYVRNLDE